MFNSNIKGTATIDKYVERGKVDKVFRAEIIKKRDFTQAGVYAKTVLGITTVDFYVIYGQLMKYDAIKKIIEYDIEVKEEPRAAVVKDVKSEEPVDTSVNSYGAYTITIGNEKKHVVDGIDFIGDSATVGEILTSQGRHISSVIDVKDKKPVPVVFPVHLTANLKPTEEPLNLLVAKMGDIDNTTNEVVEEVIIKELSGGSNESLLRMYVAVMPARYKPRFKRDAKTKKLFLVPSYYDYPVKGAYSEALVVCKALSKGSIPTGSHMAKHCADHVYGIGIPSDARRYVDFLTDFILPDGIDTVHLHTGDTKYALILYHRYPKLNIVMRGSINVEADKKKKIRITYSTLSTLTRAAGDKNVVGVFFDYVKIPDDGKEGFVERAIIADGEGRMLPRQYKHYFRYLSVFAAVKSDTIYRTSVSARNMHAIETNYCANKSGEDVICECAGMSVHYLIYPYIMMPLIKKVSFFT